MSSGQLYFERLSSDMSFESLSSANRRCICTADSDRETCSPCDWTLASVARREMPTATIARWNQFAPSPNAWHGA